MTILHVNAFKWYETIYIMIILFFFQMKSLIIWLTVFVGEYKIWLTLEGQVLNVS